MGDDSFETLSKKDQLMEGVHGPTRRKDETDFPQGGRHDFYGPPAAAKGRHCIGHEDIEDDEDFYLSDDAPEKDAHACGCSAEKKSDKEESEQRISEIGFEYKFSCCKKNDKLEHSKSESADPFPGYNRGEGRRAQISPFQLSLIAFLNDAYTTIHKHREENKHNGYRRDGMIESRRDSLKLPC